MEIGKVYLVGAGPGDYKLITLKGLECIQKADVIVYDRLANPNYLKEAKKSCEFIDVGKASSQHTLSQDKINEVMVHKAKEGKIVTRLKGGDPYVFGRGAEEAQYLLGHGIDFEVVPGITSAIAGLCYAGIPITHRDYASSFHVITGHLKEDSEDVINWNALANLQGTLVFLMGVANLKHISQKLIQEGKDPKTPVALITWATHTKQSVVTGTLQNIYDLALEKKVKPPTLIAIGEVVGLREELNFFEKRPLFGKNIVVTRAREQNSSLLEKITELGGNALAFPTIKIEEILPNKVLEESIDEMASYQYLIFTSPNTVNIFFNQLKAKGLDTRSLYHTKICSVGAGTTECLNTKGIEPDYVPQRAIGDAIYDCLKDVVQPKDRILMPKSAIARETLKQKLEQICEVKAIDLYDTIAEQIDKEMILEQLKQGNIHYITFASSSTVQYFIEGIGIENKDLLKKVKLIAIGPITSQTLVAYELSVYQEANVHTIEGIIDCLINDR